MDVFGNRTKYFLLNILVLSVVFLVPPVVALPVSANTAQIGSSSISEELIDGKRFLVVRGVIKARAEQIWQMLVDYPNSTRIFPLLKKCQVLDDNGSSKIVRQVVAPSGVPTTYDYVVQVQEIAPRLIEWHRVRGAFKELDGFWKLEPLDGGHNTLVTYASYINGGLFLPRVLIKRQFQIDMPSMMLALKTHAERFTRIASKCIANSKEP